MIEHESHFHRAASLERPKPPSGYLSWPSFSDICLEKPVNGLMEKRGGALFDSDRGVLVDRMHLYHDSGVSWRDFAARGTGLEEKRSRFDPEMARQIAITEGYSEKNIRRYAFKPFDDRWCYYTVTRPIWNDPRPKLVEWQHRCGDFVIARPKRIGGLAGTPAYYSRFVGDCDLLHGYAYFFPVLVPKAGKNDLRPNLSRKICDYLSLLGYVDSASNSDVGWIVWWHALAMTYSAAYLAENGTGIDVGYPRIPFPWPNEESGISPKDAGNLLLESMKIGGSVSKLLDTEARVEGVTTGDGSVREEFVGMGELIPVNKEAMPSNNPDNIALRGWGRQNKRDAILPESGPILQRRYSQSERASIERGTLERGLHVGAAYGVLGDTTYDVYLNEDWCWQNVPATVWNYVIGGYPVLRKWLSYRDTSVTGRALNRNELDYFTQMVRRLAALRLLEPSLNRIYARIRDCAGAFEK